MCKLYFLNATVFAALYMKPIIDLCESTGGRSSSFNIRGLGSSVKRHKVLELVRRERAEVLALQEYLV